MQQRGSHPKQADTTQLVQPHLEVQSDLFHPLLTHLPEKELLDRPYLNEPNDVQHLLGRLHSLVLSLQNILVVSGTYLGEEITDDDDNGHYSHCSQEGEAQSPVEHDESDHELEGPIEEGREVPANVGHFLCVDLAIVYDFSLSEALICLFCEFERFIVDHHGERILKVDPHDAHPVKEMRKTHPVQHRGQES